MNWWVVLLANNLIVTVILVTHASLRKRTTCFLYWKHFVCCVSVAFSFHTDPLASSTGPGTESNIISY